MGKCSAARGIEDASTRKLTMKLGIGGLNSTDKTIHVLQLVMNKELRSYWSIAVEAASQALPTAIPWRCKTREEPCPESKDQLIVLSTKAELGSCWDEDISQGSDPMTIKLKLPSGSPIVVSSARVYDEVDNSRCWKSDWRNRYSNYNQQTNDWVDGHPRSPSGDSSNNFDDDCL